MSGASLLLEWVIPIAAGAGMAWILLGTPGPGPAMSRSGAGLVYAFTRIGMLILALWMRPPGLATDLDWFRQLHVDAVLGGRIPGTDFPTWYGPFFPLLQTLGVLVTPGRATAGILLVPLAGDLLALAAAGRLDARLGWGGRWRSLRGWLLLAPAVWQQSLLRGQDEVLLLGFVLLAVALFAAGRVAGSGAALGLGLLCTKVSLLPYGLGLFLLCEGVRARLRFVAGGVVALLPGAAYVVWAGIRPLSREGMAYQTKLGGVSLTDVARRVGGEGILGPALVAAIVFATGVAIWGVRGLRRRPVTESAVGATALCHALAMGFSPSCIPPYFVQGLVLQYGLGLSSNDRPTRRLIGSGSVLVATTTCLWWTGSRAFGHSVHTLLVTGLGLATLLVARRAGTSAGGAP